MQRLSELIKAGKWEEALSYSASPLGLPGTYVAQLHLLALEQPTAAQLVELLSHVTEPEWIATAALQVARKATVPALVDAAVPAALAATDQLAQAVKALRPYIAGDLEAPEQLAELCRIDIAARKVCVIRRTLFSLQDRTQTWVLLWGAAEQHPDPKASGKDKGGEKDGAGGGDEDPVSDDGEGWDELNVPPLVPPTHPPFATFLRQPLLTTATSLASSADLDSLLVLCRRHATELWPDRFTIIDAIPEWTDPARYLDLLPRADQDGNEAAWESEPWRETADWAELVPPKRTTGTPAFSPEQLTAYYVDRSHRLAQFGLVAVALSLVQHCASRGVAGLDELGEDLSLLSKLVYDRPTPVSTPSTSHSLLTDAEEDLSLEHWRSLSPAQVFRAYLAHSTPSTLPTDIRRLVLPYLSVIESRLERTGSADPELGTRLLHEYVLELASTAQLEDLVAVFAASKPTLPRHERVIKDDPDLARLALACLYGTRDASGASLVHLGQIFECLPAFSESLEDTSSATPTLFAVFPSTARPSSITPPVLMDAVRTFPPAALSLALDALDVHLSTAETFARYSVPVALSWFLTAHDDEKAQRAWATRMARTSASGGGGREGDEGEFESEDEWEALMEDMVNLTQSADQPELSKAFWKLDRTDVLRIFFAGLLAAGKFGLAKSLFNPSSGESPLDPSVEEELVISASREFYDNAETGNLHKGDMKLAFDCLSAAPQTPTIRKERDFIEATSRLCSYKIHSHGVAVSPIEIRLSKDRLDFVAQLLGSNEDAYRHPDVVLDLVAKLGYRDDRLAQIRVLAMIAASGLQAGDFARAADVCDQMVDAVELLRKSPASSPPSAISEAAEVAWQNCFQLGKHEAFLDLERRMRLLGQALVLCPGNKIATLLPIWTRLEDRLAAPSSTDRRQSLASSTNGGATSPLSASYLHAQISPALAAETAAAATRTLSRAAAFFPFGGGGGGGGGRDGKEREKETSGQRMPESPPRAQGEEGLRAGISSRLTAGVGWLIGADDALEDRRYRESA